MNSFRLITVPNPGAGLNFTYTQPTLVASRVRECRLLFTAAAAVATRSVAVTAETGGVAVNVSIWSQSCLAGVARTYVGMSEYYLAESVFTLGANNMVIGQFGGFWLLPGMTFRSWVNNIQAADQISAIRILFEDVNIIAGGVVA